MSSRPSVFVPSVKSGCAPRMIGRHDHLRDGEESEGEGEVKVDEGTLT